MSIVLKNNAASALSQGINNSQTSIDVLSGAVFPNLSAGQYFYATIESTASVREIVKVTNVAGNTLTVVRAQDGTSAASFVEGSRVEARINAASVKDYVDQNAELAQYNQGAGTAVVRTIQSKLRETVSVKDFGAVGDGVTNDTTAIQTALNSGAKYVNGVNGTYLTDTTLQVPSNVVFDGNGAELLVSNIIFAAQTGMNAGAGSEICNWTIRSNTPGTKKGFYGINIAGNGVFVHDCYIKDIAFSAIANEANDVRVFDVTAEDCGWDLIQNFTADGSGPQRVHVHRCHAIRTGRHGFSTDTGSRDIVFEDCIATDVGNPTLNEGKDAYHYEGCIRTVVKNCVANYTANHPAVTTSAGADFMAFREFASIDSVVDGLIINIESGFVPLGGTWRSFYLDNSTANFVCRGLTVLNKSAVTFQLLWANSDAQQVREFSDFVIQGPHSWVQQGVNSGPRRMSNGSFIGTGAETSINNQFTAYNIEICNVSFSNVVNAIRLAGFQNSLIQNCRFFNCSGTAIEHDWFAFTAELRPTRGAVIGCYFSGTNGTLFASDDAQSATTFANNIINGTASVGLAAGNTLVKGFGNIVTGTVSTDQTGTNTTGAFNSDLNNLTSV